MKTAICFLAIISIFFIGFISVERPVSPSGDFCSSLKTLLEAAREGFDTVKGASAERMITGNKKNFYLDSDWKKVG